jgi:cation/acetate symporter
VTTSPLAVSVFLLFVALTLGVSFYFARKSRSAAGFFAAGGSIPWFVNGVAFAGDYLSAASFLGICGMIAFYGYDGFLYSIGYLAGWVVALFVVAEPLKRMGKYTFADALDSRFRSRGIQLTAAISTLVVSLFYLIPQMVGAGALIKPLLGLPDYAHFVGVLMVGGVVVLIVVTAGMVSTTYVQFLKGSLLVLFTLILTVMILYRGLNVPAGDTRQIGTVSKLPGGQKATGPLDPVAYLDTLRQSEIVLWDTVKVKQPDGGEKTEYRPRPTPGTEVLRAGNHPSFRGLRGSDPIPKLNFISLMLALFCGTASLPHILIRYYTVKDQAAARKSTVVGMASIGFFYVLTLFLGLGAMTSGVVDPADSNMAAPLLAKNFGTLLFAIISAIAFTTVLGTVSGLIVAASGAVVHDLLVSFFKIPLADRSKVRIGKLAAVVVGVIAIALGIVFKGMNVSYLVGWAFSVAASANLPSLAMVLFWKGTTRQGVTAAVATGMVSSLAWILLSADTFKDIYGLPPSAAPVPFSQPGIVTIPLGFVVLIGVSLATRKRAG